MTPQELIDQITTLVRQARDREAVEQCEQVGTSLYACMTVEQKLELGWIMETAATAVALEDAERLATATHQD